MNNLTSPLLSRQQQNILKSNRIPSLVIGNRIPKDYFIAKGTGESDITVHAGSYHLALHAARIEMCNMMSYSSILPGIANLIDRPEKLVHGCVMEAIVAAADAAAGERATAGIIYGWLYDRKSGDKYGGLVCEYNGKLPVEEATESLNLSLQELYTNGYSDDYEMRDITLNTESFMVKKKHGTALVALCFTSYEYPILNQ